MDELPAEGSRGHITKHDHTTDKETRRGDLTQQEVTESGSLPRGEMKFHRISAGITGRTTVKCGSHRHLVVKVSADLSQTWQRCPRFRSCSISLASVDVWHGQVRTQQVHDDDITTFDSITAETLSGGKWTSTFRKAPEGIGDWRCSETLTDMRNLILLWCEYNMKFASLSSDTGLRTQMHDSGFFTAMVYSKCKQKTLSGRKNSQGTNSQLGCDAELDSDMARRTATGRRDTHKVKGGD